MKKIGLLPRILIAIALGVVVGAFLPEWTVRLFATFNDIFGNFLGFAIPLIIIGFIAPGIGEIGKGAGKLIGITTTVAYLSTFLAGLLAFVAARNLYPIFLNTGGAASEMANPEEGLLEPFFKVEIAPMMGVMTALVLAFTLGLGMAAMKENKLKGVMVEFRTIIEKVINYVIIPLLPLHILGIFANMTSAGQVQTILSVFAKVFVMIILLHLTMLLIQYSVTGAATSRNPFKLLKTMVPAYFTALGTQSSASTIPVTLRQVKKNGVREKVAEFSVPLLATIHLSGSTITIVSCAMAVMLLNGMDPTFASIIPFILMLGITMIAAPGVPGGAVMAAIGLLESMLSFDSTMVSLMIALYLAQDSFGTATNVTGDGALSGLVDRLTSKKKKVQGAAKVS